METALTGLTLHVADVERALDFYKGIPGARVQMHRPGDFALLDFGGGRLGLLAVRFLGAQASPFHLEIASTKNGVDELYDQFQASGIETLDAPTDRGWGERTFHAHDPDGNLIEFDSRLND